MKQKLFGLLMVAAAAHVSAQVTDAMIAKDDTNSVLSWGMGTQGRKRISRKTKN